MAECYIDEEIRDNKEIGSAEDVERKFHFFRPLYFPFLQDQWFLKIWWLPLLSLFPPLAICILRGWRVNIVRRICDDKGSLLPDFSGIFRCLFDGSLLVFMTFLYAIIPTMIIIGFSLDGLGDLIGDMKTIYRMEGFFDLVAYILGEIWENILVIFIKYGWLVVSIPLYRAAFLRYCSSGKIRAFFNIPASVLFIAKNLKQFAKLYLFMFIFGFFWLFLVAFFSSTGIGLVILPFMLPFYYWSTAYAFGQLATTVEG